MNNTLEKWLPYILSGLLASLGLTVHTLLFGASGWAETSLQWVISVLMLFTIWHANLRMSEIWKPYLIFLANMALIFSYAYITIMVFPHFHYGIASLRLVMPTILFVVLQHNLRTVKQGEKLKLENLQLKAENYKAELEHLKKQLNPHFLFNSLTTLQTVIRSDREMAEKYVIKLADIYRSMLQGQSSEKTSLAEELKFIESYLFLQKIRFENALFFQISLEKGSLAFQLPTFALQLLVENCIKHNVVSDESPLHIQIFQQDPTTVTVSNNFQPKIRREESTGTGLQNLRRRYELLGIQDGMAVNAQEQTYSVTLKLF